jgi:hypothetical protein
MLNIEDIKKVKDKRKSKITNSYGIIDYYHYYRKDNTNINRAMYLKIVKAVSDKIIYYILKGYLIKLPYSFGTILLIKSPKNIDNYGNKLSYSTKVNWHETLKLWQEDTQAYQDRQVIKFNSEYTYKIKHSNIFNSPSNLKYYKFKFPRRVYLLLKNMINNYEADALLENKYYGKTNNKY